MGEVVIKNVPYHLQVYKILKQAILNGELKGGERILENKISRELGVSRSPVREALRMLEQDRLLVPTPEGLIVNSLNFEDAQEIYQCRMAIEPFAARLAADRLEEAHWGKMSDYIRQARSYHQKDDYHKIVEVNTKFHNLILDNCGNKRLQDIIGKISALSILCRTAEFQLYKRSDAYLQEHEALLKALKERDKNNIEYLYREHIEHDFDYYKKSFQSSKNIVL